MNPKLLTKLLSTFSFEEIETLSKGFRFDYNEALIEEKIKKQDFETTRLEDPCFQDIGIDTFIYSDTEDDRYVVPLRFDTSYEALAFVRYLTGEV